MTDDEHRLRKANLARYFSADPNTRTAIVQALSRLPNEVLEFAISECVFVSVGEGLAGQCLPARFVADAKWLINLYESATGLETIVAHELAHAYLGHSIGDRLSDEETER